MFNEHIDIVTGRPDSQNWIPFDFMLDVAGCKYKYQEEGTCLTVWEAKKIINGFQDIIDIVRNNTQRDFLKARFLPFEHTSYEVFLTLRFQMLIQIQ